MVGLVTKKVIKVITPRSNEVEKQVIKVVKTSPLEEWNKTVEFFTDRNDKMINTRIVWDAEANRFDKPPSWSGYTKPNYSHKGKIKPGKPLAVVTGNTFIVVDVDFFNEKKPDFGCGMKAWEAWMDEHEEPITWKQKSMTGGLHYFFKYTEKLDTRLKKISDHSFIHKEKLVNIDIRSKGGYIMVAPTEHEEKKYEWIHSPFDTELAECPDWLLSYMLPIGKNLPYKEKVEKDESDKFLEAVQESTPAIVTFFCEVKKDDIITVRNSAKSYTVYMWNEKTKLWDQNYIEDLINEIAAFMEGHFKILKDRADDKTKLEELKKIATKNLKRPNRKDIAEDSLPKLKNDAWEKKLDIQRGMINFKNVILDLKTGIARERRKDDYIMTCIQIDYFPIEETEDEAETDKNRREKIVKMMADTKNKILEVCNNDIELCTFMFDYFGYALTGERYDQIFFIAQGPKGGGGKSTMAELFEVCMPEYIEKLDQRTFNNNYGKAHKQLDAIRNCIKICYLEEMDSSKLNVSLIKEWVSALYMKNEEMFKTTKKIKTVLTYITTNKMPNFDTEGGMPRRLKAATFENQFLEKDAYAKAKAGGKTNVYLKDATLKAKFESDDLMKLSFVQLLIASAKKYYKVLNDTVGNSGLIIPDIVNLTAKAICDENDRITQILDAKFDRTDDKEDRISKHEFTRIWQDYFNCKTPWNVLISDVKKVDLSYDDQLRKDGDKGVILYLKLKEVVPKTAAEKLAEEEKKTIEALRNVKMPEESPLDDDPDADSEDEESEDEEVIVAEKPKTKHTDAYMDFDQ